MLAVLGTEVGRVDDREAAGGEALGGDVVEHVEGIGGGGLVALVVGDHPAVVVGGEDLGRGELPGREAGLAGAGSAHQHDEREVGDRQAHVNTAICVGWPNSGWGSPIPSRWTV